MKLGPEWKEIGRLAMRVEGKNWNAYYALPSTMQGALFIGSIPMVFISRKNGRREAFLNLMRECVADILEETTGQRPRFQGERPAPEHERTKE